MMGTCQVGLSKDLVAGEIKVKKAAATTPGGGGGGKSTALTVTVGELYFDVSKIKAHLANVGQVGKGGAQKLEK